MKTLITLTLAGAVAAGLFSTTASANELQQQLHNDAKQQHSAFYQASMQEARAALLQMAIEAQAHQSAEQFATELLAKRVAATDTSKAD